MHAAGAGCARPAGMTASLPPGRLHRWKGQQFDKNACVLQRLLDTPRACDGRLQGGKLLANQPRATARRAHVAQPAAAPSLARRRHTPGQCEPGTPRWSRLAEARLWGRAQRRAPAAHGAPPAAAPAPAAAAETTAALRGGGGCTAPTERMSADWKGGCNAVHDCRSTTATFNRIQQSTGCTFTTKQGAWTNANRRASRVRPE